MPVHPVNQLRFTRIELMRCLEGVSAEDAVKRLPPMNCISWMVGHLATHENAYWNFVARGLIVQPGLRELTGPGKPASTSPLHEMIAAWREVTARADGFLDALTPADLEQFLLYNGKALDVNTGTLLLQVTYHYWFHIGEMYAVRQQLGHTGLPEFIGDMSGFYYHTDLSAVQN
ncbi:MAG: DinB family protein [Anaerolineaceae bacterium]